MPNKGGFLGGLRVGEPFLFYLLINLLFYLLISLSAGWGGGGTGAGWGGLADPDRQGRLSLCAQLPLPGPPAPPVLSLSPHDLLYGFALRKEF